jgi:adenylylsulfate kinase
MSREPESVTPSQSQVSREDRVELLGHDATTVWVTGLSGSGKSTCARAVERALVEQGFCAYVLDGDDLRSGLSSDLGFSADDRSENIRRIGEVARLFNEAGVIVLTAFISPYKKDRERARNMLPPGGFIEVLVDCPLEECERRDVKGLYAKARAGDLPDFTGIGAPYERPERPDLVLRTGEVDLETCVEQVLTHLRRSGVTR